MSTLSFEYETKDLYQLGTEEATSRLIEIEFDVEWAGGDFQCDIEYMWCMDSKKFIGDAPYKLTERDLKGIRDRMLELSNQSFGTILEDHKDSIFDSVFGDR